MIGLGAVLGVFARHGISLAIGASGGFPIATLLVNLLGCGATGCAHALLPAGSPARLFVAVGVLGGFTTFSTFSYETLTLLQADRGRDAALYQLVSVGGGVFVVWLRIRTTMYVRHLITSGESTL